MYCRIGYKKKGKKINKMQILEFEPKICIWLRINAGTNFFSL